MPLEDSGLTIIDAHHHLWDLKAVNYPWLMAQGVTRFFGDPTPIQKNYYPTDLNNDAAPLKLSGSVHIQVGAADGTAETEWIEDLDTELPSAHIAYLALDDRDIIDKIDALKANNKVRGVRQIIGRHPAEDAVTGTDTLLSNPLWIEGLREIAAADLSFDLQLIAPQYHSMADILETVPHLRVAICHFASPWDQGEPDFNHWYDAMKRYAALPNVTMKLSGFSMFKPDWSHDDIRPYIEAALEHFGTSRVMIGSNYPVDGLHRPCRDIFDAVYTSMQSHTLDEQQEVFAGTAKRFYRL